MKNRYTGFLAQDVEKAAKSLYYDFSGIDKPADEKKSAWGLRYSDFVVPMVKDVQELAAENDANKQANSALQQANDELKKRLDKIEMLLAGNNAAPGTAQSVTLSSPVAEAGRAMLYQNAPNPFSGQTTIHYFLPNQTVTAAIYITAADGKTVKTIALSAKGNGQLNVQIAQMASGTYRYSLVVVGKIIDTKTMVLAK